MAPSRSPWTLALTLAGTAACSLLIPFNPEGLPCGTGEACLPGYACVEGVCRASTTPQDPCSYCRADERCKPDKSGCEPKTCANTPCPAGEICREMGGVPLCVPREAPLAGHPCAVNADCDVTTGRVCARGQRPRRLPDGGTGDGICITPCLDAAQGCVGSEPLTCAEYRSGLDAFTGRACLAADTLLPCKADADCTALSPDFTCAQFAHHKLGGFIQACDLPVPGGAQLGEACGTALPSPSVPPAPVDGGVRDGGSADGGALGAGAGPPVRCARGSCVMSPDGGTACAPSCLLGGCAAPDECRTVEVTLGNLSIRPAACVEATGCEACSTDLSCGGDAPHCTSMPDGGKACLIACWMVRDGGSAACPAGQACQQFGTESRCVPAAPAKCP
ncbi:MAG: hypothetical protein FJ086_05160 [Deltaproteobacteria bacterium]|nr:hypothetical protein [Deltaproteobacteria bacterium]